ncbi:MAG: tRNA (adenosine(37)-N6)-threonylcarbamoyltransferase complex ATPase subunit type 1 TsaE [Bacilli bacterium]
MTYKIQVKSEKESTALALKLAKNLKAGDVILLEGDLGSGKTFFAKGVGLGLMVNETVISPTFNIVRCYFKGRLPLYHIDAYRLEDCQQDIGLEEYLEGDGVSLVEWPEYIQEFWPDEYLKISIEISGKQSRDYTFLAKGRRYEGLLKVIKNG